jgi:hypothetical protein
LRANFVFILGTNANAHDAEKLGTKTTTGGAVDAIPVTRNVTIIGMVANAPIVVRHAIRIMIGVEAQ